jgi:release factor glutamine methyltransferase
MPNTHPPERQAAAPEVARTEPPELDSNVMFREASLLRLLEGSPDEALAALASGHPGDLAHLAAEAGFDLRTMVEAHRQGMPWAYALGHASFMGRLFRCSPAAMIPREETELLARIVIQLARARGGSPRLLDIGTGCGNLALTLALEVPGALVHASDIKRAALDLARLNVDLHGVQDRVTLHHGSLFDAFGEPPWRGKVDLVLCNPPYIPTSSVDRMPSEIRDYEPRSAFDAGSFGIDILRGLIKGAVDFLVPGGFLAFEIGVGQEVLVTRLFRGTPSYDAVEMHRDAEGNIRVFTARRGDGST